MATKKNSILGTLLVAPALIIGAVLALWENEGRFDYYKAARETQHVTSVKAAPPDVTVSYTARLNTGIPIEGEYVRRFMSFHVVRRYAEIYSWEEDESDEGSTWELGWHSSVESNSRNHGINQRLSGATLYPPRYELGGLRVSPERIHFVDAWTDISPGSVELSETGRGLGLMASGEYFYLARQAGTDTLGDERVSYRGVPNADTATYFGLVTGGEGIGRQFGEHTGIISQMIDNDGILHHLVNGTREPALEKIREDLVRKMWLVRAVGTVVIVLGFYMLFSTFTGLLYRLPLIGNLVSLAVFLASTVLGLGLALFVILASLVFHNPLTVALPLILVIAAVGWLVQRSRQAKANARQLMEARLAARRNADAVQARRDAVATNAAVAAANVAPPSTGTAPAPATPVPGRPPGFDLVDTAGIEQTFRDLAILALAEGGFDKKENRFLVEWGKRNGVTPDRMKELFAEARKAGATVAAGSREDLELLVCMAMSDGVVSRQEWSLLMGIAGKVGISPVELRNMIVEVETGTPATA